MNPVKLVEGNVLYKKLEVFLKTLDDAARGSVGVSLTNLVHDMKSQEANVINEAGLDAIVRYVIDAVGEDTAEGVFRNALWKWGFGRGKK